MPLLLRPQPTYPPSVVLIPGSTLNQPRHIAPHYKPSNIEGFIYAIACPISIPCLYTYHLRPYTPPMHMPIGKDSIMPRDHV